MKKTLEGDDSYKSQRIRMNKEFNKYTDGNNSYRTYTEILKFK